MARIENDNQPDNSLDKMQKEIEHLKHSLKSKQSKKFLSCRNLMFFLLAVGLCFLIFTAYLVAKSGIATVPVLTGLVYHEPKPVYEVRTINFSDKDLLEKIKPLAQNEVLKQKTTNNLLISVPLTEEEATGLLNFALKSNSQTAEKIEFWQLAIMPESLELFAKTKQPKDWIFTLNFTPGIENKNLSLVANSFKIGDLTLPRFLSSFFISNLGVGVLNSLIDSSANIGEIQEISLADKQLTLKILIYDLLEIN